MRRDQELIAMCSDVPPFQLGEWLGILEERSIKAFQFTKLAVTEGFHLRLSATRLLSGSAGRENGKGLLDDRRDANCAQGSKRRRGREAVVAG